MLLNSSWFCALGHLRPSHPHNTAYSLWIRPSPLMPPAPKLTISGKILAKPIYIYHIAIQCHTVRSSLLSFCKLNSSCLIPSFSPLTFELTLNHSQFHLVVQVLSHSGEQWPHDRLLELPQGELETALVTSCPSCAAALVES